MTNLLPPAGKKSVQREYLFRVIAIWAFLLAGTLLAISFMLLPTYVIISQRLSVVLIEYEQLVVDDESEYQESRDVIQTANMFAVQLKQRDEVVPVSTILTNIRSALSSFVAMESLLYTYADTDTVTLEIKGLAETREDLVTFKEDLEKNPLFIAATVPVSNLAKNTDAPFTITVVLRSTK